MKKAFLSLILCLCMISSCALASIDTLSFTSAGKTIEIEGSSDIINGEISLTIIKSSGENPFADSSAFTTHTMLFHSMTTDSEGKYTGKYRLPSSADSGFYTVYAQNDSKEFYYATDAEINSCISDFKTATVDNIDDVLKLYTVTKNVLGTKASDTFYKYETFANKALVELLAKEATLDTAKITACLAGAATAAVYMGGDKAEVKSVLQSGELDIAVDSTANIDTLSAMLVSLRTNEPISSNEKILDYIPKTVAASSAIVLVNSATKGEMTSVLKKYHAVLELASFSDYTSLTSEDDIIKVNKYLTEKAFTSRSAIQSAFADGMKSLGGTGGGSGSTGGSGGSGGGGAGISKGDVDTKYEIIPPNDDNAATDKPTVNTFADLATVSWAQGAISKLNELGIVSGYEDGSYRPMQNVTRAELTKLVQSLKSHAPLEENNSKIKVATVGDSLTQGFIGDDGKYTTSESYSDYLRKYLGDSYEVKNFGLSSHGIYKQHEYSYTNTNEYKASLEYNPDIVVVMFGTNDAKTAYWDDIKEQYASMYRDFLNTYSSLGSSPQIICLLPPPVFGTSNFATDRPEQNMTEIREIIKMVTAEEGIPLINSYDIFTESSLLFPDGLHYNRYGADIVANEISKVIMSDTDIYVSFRDVNSNDWFYDIISEASKDGIVNGSGSFFYPDNPVTREDAAVIIYRFLSKYKSFGGKKVFADAANTSDYAGDAVSYLAGAGIINGMGNDMFLPKNLLTRAEAAVLINSALNYVR